MTMGSSSREHHHRATEASSRNPIGCAVLTISDTRTGQTDLSGPLIESLLAEHGHQVLDRAIVRDDAEAIKAQLASWIADERTQVVLTTGGTGLGRRDTSIEVVRELITVEIDGFGELFRMLSHRKIGAAAMLSRAVAGLVCSEHGSSRDTFIFAMPGSTDAVETAMRELIAPELAHLVWQRGEGAQGKKS